jgi:hypothetical protein
MLDSIEHVMPIAQSEWDAVVLLHNERFPRQVRTAELPHHKFQEVVCKTSLTGDLNALPTFVVQN